MLEDDTINIYHLTRQELNLFKNSWPELCCKCWNCNGIGMAQSCGHLADCPYCLSIGVVPDWVKVARKILRDKFPPDSGSSILRGTLLYQEEGVNDES